MSKLSKLTSQPGAFFKDAFSNARVRLQLRALTGKDEEQMRRRVELVHGSSPLAEALLEAIDNTADVFLARAATEYDEFNCFVADLPWLVYHASLLAESRQAELLLTIRRRTQVVARRDIPALAGRLLAANDFDIIMAKGALEESVRVCVWEKRDAEGVHYCRGQNMFAKKVSFADFESVRDRAAKRVCLEKLYEYPIHAVCDFDVDFVYTWVNHADPTWRKLIGKFRRLSDIDWDRYRSADELRYSLRSVHEYASWARRIYIVTNCEPPAWLKDHPKIRWVTHQDIFPDSEDYLPTFSSHAIESCLMRIEGLSEQFVYMNDDVFLGMPCSKLDFFWSNGTSVAYFEPYGMVSGQVTGDNPDYLNAAINGRRIIEETFGVSPTQLHAHTPHALKKSVLFELEDRFSHQFDDVRRARFRTRSDVSVVSFLYHHYAFQTRHAQPAAGMNTILVRPSNSSEAYVEMLSGRRRRFFCINDGGASALDKGYHAKTAKFLETYFPFAAPWER